MLAAGATEGSIQPWYLDGESQEAEGALDAQAPNAHLVKNHGAVMVPGPGRCQLTYNQVRRAVWGIQQKIRSTRLADVEAVAVLHRAMTDAPLAESIHQPEVMAAYVQVADAPVPGTDSAQVKAEREFLAGYDEQGPRGTVLTGKGELVPQLLPVEVAAEDPWDCSALPSKIEGWSPTNVYVGAVKESQTTGAASYSWIDNTVKFARVFTTASAYTTSGFFLRLAKVGTLTTGEITIRIYAGDPTGAQVTLVTGTISVLEVSAAGTVFLPFGGSASALANATVHTLEATTTCPLTAGNYLYFTRLTTGGAAGDQDWLYTGGAWVAQGTNRADFVMADNSDGGKFFVRADANLSALGAGGVKGAAIATTDTMTVSWGATLTMNASAAFLQARTGDNVIWASGITYSAPITTYRYGSYIVNGGVTLTFTGNATAASSGLLSNPTTADTSSKSCSLTINGNGSPAIFTNAAGAYSATQRYCINWVYGFFGTMGTWQLNYPSTATSLFAFSLPPTAAYTTASSHNLGTVSHLTGNIGAIYATLFTHTVAAARTIPVTIESVTIDASAQATAIAAPATYFTQYGNASATDNAAFTVKAHKFIGSATQLSAVYRTMLRLPAGGTLYSAALRDDPATDIRPTTVVPTGLAVVPGTIPGSIYATFTNVAAYAAGDVFLFYCNGVLFERISKVEYLAAGGAVISPPLMAADWNLTAAATSDNFVLSAPCAPLAIAVPTWGPGELSGVH
jgi:hypothetical protein